MQETVIPTPEQATSPKEPAFAAERIADDAAIEALLQEWLEVRDLFEGVNFIQDLERLALERRLRGLEVEFVTLRAAGQLVGYAPLIMVDEPMTVDFGLKTLFRASAPRARLIGGGDIPLASGIDEPQALTALMGKLAEDGLDLITIEECALDSRIVRNGGLGPYRLRPFDSETNMIHVLELPESHDAFMKSLRKKTRDTLKRQVKQFAKAFGGEVRLQRVSTPEDVPAFVAAVGSIYQRSWKLGTLNDDPVVTEADIPYLQALAKRGALRSYVIYGREEPISFSYMLQANGRCDFLDIAYDQQHSKLSTGRVILFHILEDFYASDTPEILDFGYGDNLYKKVFANRSIDANIFFAVRPGTKAARMVQAQTLVRKGYRGARSALVALKLDQRLRQLLKGGKKRDDAQPATAIAEQK